MNEPVSNRRPPPLLGFFVVVEVPVVGGIVGWVLDIGAGLLLVGFTDEWDIDLEDVCIKLSDSLTDEDTFTFTDIAEETDELPTCEGCTDTLTMIDEVLLNFIAAVDTTEEDDDVESVMEFDVTLDAECVTNGDTLEVLWLETQTNSVKLTTIPIILAIIISVAR